MEWVIVLTGIALMVYVFGVPSAHTRRMADPVAAGAARGARRATYRYFRRRDWAWVRHSVSGRADVGRCRPSQQASLPEHAGRPPRAAPRH